MNVKHHLRSRGFQYYEIRIIITFFTTPTDYLSFYIALFFFWIIVCYSNKFNSVLNIEGGFWSKLESIVCTLGDQK